MSKISNCTKKSTTKKNPTKKSTTKKNPTKKSTTNKKKVKNNMKRKSIQIGAGKGQTAFKRLVEQIGPSNKTTNQIADAWSKGVRTTPYERKTKYKYGTQPIQQILEPLRVGSSGKYEGVTKYDSDGDSDDLITTFKKRN